MVMVSFSLNDSANHNYLTLTLTLTLSCVTLLDFIITIAQVILSLRMPSGTDLVIEYALWDIESLLSVCIYF